MFKLGMLGRLPPKALGSPLKEVAGLNQLPAPEAQPPSVPVGPPRKDGMLLPADIKALPMVSDMTFSYAAAAY
jgi:hypothetical protein